MALSKKDSEKSVTVLDPSITCTTTITNDNTEVDASHVPDLMRSQSNKRILNKRPSVANTKKLRMRSLLWVKPHVNENHLSSCLIAQLLPVLLVNLTTISAGFGLGFSAVSLPQLQNSDKTSWSLFHTSFSVNDEEASWIAGIYGIGAIFGGFAAGILGGNLGRKKALAILAFPDLLGWIFMVCSRNVLMMLIGRFLCGFSAAGYFPTVQVYVAEICQPKHRGWMNALSITLLASGNFLSYLVGAATSWWVLCLCGLVLPIILLPLLYFLPDSPYWYLENGQEKKALKVMEYFRSSDANALAELLAISDSLQKNTLELSTKDTFEKLMHRQFRRPFLILNTLFLLMSFSGKFAIGFYAVDIFKNASDHVNAYTSTVTVGFIRVLGSFLYPLAIRRYSRKALLSLSSVMMAMSMTVMGLTMYSHTHKMMDLSLDWVPVICITIYMIADAVGLGSIPFLYLGEFYASEMRSLLSGVTVGLSNLEAFLIVKMYPEMNSSFGHHGTFWLYAGVCFFAAFYSLLFVPETGGKSLKEIEDLFAFKESLHVTPYVTPHNTPRTAKRGGVGGGGSDTYPHIGLQFTL